MPNKEKMALQNIGYYEQIAHDLFMLMDEAKAAGDMERVKKIKNEIKATKTKIDNIRNGI